MSCVICNASLAGLNPRRITCSATCDRQKRRLSEAAYRARVREKAKALPAEVACQGCRKVLPAAAFHRNRARANGLQNTCKACRAEYAKRPDQQIKDRLRKHVWYLLHWEAVRKRERERFLFDREFRARHIADRLERYHADPKAEIARRKELRHLRSQWDHEDRRRCFCGAALPAEGDRWFCKVACKLACSRFVVGLAPPPLEIAA